MDSIYVGRLLGTVYDHSSDPSAKREAESLLGAFSSSPDGLPWAVNVLLHRIPDSHQQFFAAQIIENVVTWRWSQLPPAQQSTLQDCLIDSVINNSILFKVFVLEKLRTALARLACMWPLSFWLDFFSTILRDQTADVGRHTASVCLLERNLDELYSLAQGTTAALSGKIISRDIPAMQSRFKEIYPLVISLLGEYLQTAISTNNTSLCHATVTALHTILPRHISSSSEAESQHILNLSPLLLQLLNLATTQTDSTNEQLLIACKAMATLEHMIQKPQPLQQMQQLIYHVLSAVSGTIRACISHHPKITSSDQWPSIIGSITMLLSTSITHGLQAKSVPDAPIVEVLNDVLTLMVKAPTVVNACAAFHAWHTVLNHMEEDFDELDEIKANNDDGAGSRGSMQWALYEPGILWTVATCFASILPDHAPLITSMLLSHPHTFQSSILFSACSEESGSGSAVEEFLNRITGGDEGDQEISMTVYQEGFVDDDHYRLNLDVPNLMIDLNNRGNASRLSQASEKGIFLRQAEYFIARTASCFGKHTISTALVTVARVILHEAVVQNSFDDAETQVKVEWVLSVLSGCIASLPTTRFMSPPVHNNIHTLPTCMTVEKIHGGDVLELLQLIIKYAGGAVQVMHGNKNHNHNGGRDDEKFSIHRGATAAFRILLPLMTIWIPQIMFTLQRPEQGNTTEEYSMLGNVLLSNLELIAAALEIVSKPPSPFSSSSSSSSSSFSPSFDAQDALATSILQNWMSITTVTLTNRLKIPLALYDNILSSSAFTAINSLLSSQFEQLPVSNILSYSNLIRPLCVGLFNLELNSCECALTMASMNTRVRGLAQNAALQPVLEQRLHYLKCCTIINISNSLRPSASYTERLIGITCARDIVSSCLGMASKPIRHYIYTFLVHPVLNHTVSILGTHDAIEKGLLGLYEAIFRSFSVEIGSDGIRQLLSTLVAAKQNISLGGVRDNNNSKKDVLETDLMLFRVITSVLGQSGNKHEALVVPALLFGQSLWSEAAPFTHIRAHALAGLLNIVQHHWRSVMPSSQGTTGAGQGVGSVTATVTITLDSVKIFFIEAAEGRSIPSSNDLKLVLEELFELQTVSKIFWKPIFVETYKNVFMDALMRMLLTRMYTAAQDYLVDVLYSLAASNWTDFYMVFLNGFVENRLSHLSSKAQELATGMGMGDQDACSFEKAVLSFVNDVIYVEKGL